MGQSASDDEWERATEDELRTRLAAVGATSITCTSPTCELVLEAPDDDALSKLIAELESPDVLADFADNIVIDAPVDSDGGRRVTVTAHFAR